MMQQTAKLLEEGVLLEVMRNVSASLYYDNALTGMMRDVAIQRDVLLSFLDLLRRETGEYQPVYMGPSEVIALFKAITQLDADRFNGFPLSQSEWEELQQRNLQATIVIDQTAGLTDMQKMLDNPYGLLWQQVTPDDYVAWMRSEKDTPPEDMATRYAVITFETQVETRVMGQSRFTREAAEQTLRDVALSGVDVSGTTFDAMTNLIAALCGHALRHLSRASDDREAVWHCVNEIIIVTGSFTQLPDTAFEGFPVSHSEFAAMYGTSMMTATIVSMGGAEFLKHTPFGLAWKRITPLRFTDWVEAGRPDTDAPDIGCRYYQLSL